MLLPGGRHLTADLLDEFGDDEPLVAEDIRPIHSVLSVGHFGEPAAAGSGEPHGEVLGDGDVAVAEVRHRLTPQVMFALRRNTTAREGFCQHNSSLAEGLYLLYKGAMADEKMLTTSEVAERLGVSLRRVRQLIEEGRLPSKQFGRDHLINEPDLKLVEDRKPGRPPKKASEKGRKQ